MRQWRALLVVVFLFGALTVSRAAIAQPAGSELAEAVAADVAGDDAYVTLASVAAFSADGGEAVFEPGTDYEEAFTYAAVDADTNRLTGLTRPVPLAHAAGVFVQAPASSATTTPEPAPSATSPPAEESPVGAEDAGSSANGSGGDADPASQEPATSDDAASDASEPPDPCVEIKGGETCVSGVVDALIDFIFSNCEGDLCEVAQDPCGEIGCDVGDPCDPDNSGQTCGQYVASWLVAIADVIADPCGAVGLTCGATDPCDPDNTGQTCEEYLSERLECQGDGDDLPTCEIPNLDDDVDRVCDPSNTGQTCEEYIQRLLPGPCEVSADAPYVGDLAWPVPRNDVVIGSASGRCPYGPGGVVLVICLEHGALPYITVEQPPCTPWPSPINRVDGYDWQPCRPGFWRTYAFLAVDGFVLADDHSGVVQVQPEDCLRFLEEI